MFGIVGRKEILVIHFYVHCISPELILIKGLLDAPSLARLSV